jgi:tripartite-type tricarboxylate transporter receptor subunit TctC
MLHRSRFPWPVVTALAVFWLAGINPASALDYPTRPVTIVVPFPAGRPADTVARLIADGTRAPLGQPIIVENVAGANGTIGVGRVAHATPDGYTLSYGLWSTHVANGAIYALPYDLLKDFEPITLVVNNTNLIVANKANPANDLAALITWLRANPRGALWEPRAPAGRRTWAVCSSRA